MSVKNGSSSGFIDRLEALRGVAALWVAVGHSLIWLSIGSESAIWSKPIWKIGGVQATIARAIISVFSGAAAVDVFFVLSGFVLARSLSGLRLSVDGYARFAIKRLFRIIPAFWFSLLTVALYLSAAYPGFSLLPGASAWFNNWYRDPVTIRAVFENATFISPLLNPNAWTLKVEILGSLVLPFIVWWMAPRSLKRSVALLICSVALAWSLENDASGLPHYLYMFVVGSIVATHDDLIATRILESRLFVILCLAIIVAPSACFPLVHSICADLLVVSGSAGLIWVLSSGRDVRLLRPLDATWARFLGKVSYSFYLLHFIVLYAVANLMLRTIPGATLVRWPLVIMIASCVISIAISIPLALLSYQFVEKPFTVLGRRYSRVRTRLLQQ